MTVVIASAEHTGTHFTARVVAHLLNCSAAWLTTGIREEYTKPNVGVLMLHIYHEGFMSHADAVLDVVVKSRVPLIVPLREPLRALITKSERPDDPLTTFGLAKSMRRVASLTPTLFWPIEHGDVESLANALCVEPRPLPFIDRNAAPAEKWSPLRDEDIDSQWAAFQAEREELAHVRDFYQDAGYYL